MTILNDLLNGPIQYFFLLRTRKMKTMSALGLDKCHKTSQAIIMHIAAARDVCYILESLTVSWLPSQKVGIL
jgi:hypothetical protein